MSGRMNERYKLLIIARHAALLGLDPLTLTFISPPTKGKTDTKRTFLREYIDCNEITSMSDTALGDALLDKKMSPLLIVDDPLNWLMLDFENLVRYFKNLYDGYIVTPRKTKFKKDDIPVPANISTALFLHSKQYNEVERKFGLTGYDERALMIWSMHDKPTTSYIANYYERYNINTARKRYPVFDLEGFKVTNPPRKIEKDEAEWISSVFGGTGQERTVKTICRCVSKETFENLEPALQSNNKRQMFIEQIKFKEKIEWKEGSTTKEKED